MTAGAVIRRARRQAGLSLRELGRRAETSHSTIAAYEAGTKQPSVATLERVVGAAGYALTVDLDPRIRASGGRARGDELVEVLDLAGRFPARHRPTLDAPPFGPG